MATTTEQVPATEQKAEVPDAKTTDPTKTDSTTKDEPKGPMKLIGKLQHWAGEHKGLAIGGAVSAGVLATLAIAAYPLWKKVIKPKMDEMKKKKASNRYVKRSADDEVLEEMLHDEEFLSFLEELAMEME